MTRLTDTEIVTRAVTYFSYLRSVCDKYHPSNEVLMDEMVVLL